MFFSKKSGTEVFQSNSSAIQYAKLNDNPRWGDLWSLNIKTLVFISQRPFYVFLETRPLGVLGGRIYTFIGIIIVVLLVQGKTLFKLYHFVCS